MCHEDNLEEGYERNQIKISQFFVKKSKMGGIICWFYIFLLSFYLNILEEIFCMIENYWKLAKEETMYVLNMCNCGKGRVDKESAAQENSVNGKETVKIQRLGSSQGPEEEEILLYHVARKIRRITYEANRVEEFVEISQERKE